MFRCWILHLPLCLLWQSHYPIRASALSFMDLVCFILASKKERGCYNPCGGRCWVRYSQIAGGMSYQLMPGFILGLHDLCTFRNGWTTGWTKGRKNSTTSSQIRTDCSQLNESLTHAPVTGSEQRYLKGDYQRLHSVPVRLYSLCPGISKQARQGLSLDNMGRNKRDRCYLFHLWPFYPNSDFHPARDFKHVCICLPFSVTLKA